MSIEIYIFQKGSNICRYRYRSTVRPPGHCCWQNCFMKQVSPFRSNLVQIFETWIIVIIDRVNISNYAINGNILYPFKKEGLFEHERNIIQTRCVNTFYCGNIFQTFDQILSSFDVFKTKIPQYGKFCQNTGVHPALQQCLHFFTT